MAASRPSTWPGASATSFRRSAGRRRRHAGCGMGASPRTTSNRPSRKTLRCAAARTGGAPRLSTPFIRNPVPHPTLAESGMARRVSAPRRRRGEMGRLHVPIPGGGAAGALTSRPMRYRVSMPEPHGHLFHVELAVEHPGDTLVLAMPVWTPGSYLVREFARHVEGLAVEDDGGRPLRVERLDKRRYRVAASGTALARVRYRVFAHELTVRTCHLDGTHGFFNGAALLLYAEGREREAHVLEVAPPPGWKVATALPPAAGGRGLERRVGLHGARLRRAGGLARGGGNPPARPIRGAREAARDRAVGPRDGGPPAARVRGAPDRGALRRAHGWAPLRALPLHRAPRLRRARGPRARGEHGAPREAHRLLPARRLRRDPGALRARALPRVEREGAQARRPPAVRLRAGAVHAAPVVVRGRDELLRRAGARAHQALRAEAVPEAPGRGAYRARAAPRRGEDEPRGGEPHRLGEVLPARREQPEQRGLLLSEGRARRARPRPAPAARRRLARRARADAARAARPRGPPRGRRGGGRGGERRAGRRARVLRSPRAQHGGGRARSGAARARGEAPPRAGARRQGRSEERRVGKECRSRWSPYH